PNLRARDAVRSVLASSTTTIFRGRRVCLTTDARQRTILSCSLCAGMMTSTVAELQSSADVVAVLSRRCINPVSCELFETEAKEEPRSTVGRRGATARPGRSSSAARTASTENTGLVANNPGRPSSESPCRYRANDWLGAKIFAERNVFHANLRMFP